MPHFTRRQYASTGSVSPELVHSAVSHPTSKLATGLPLVPVLSIRKFTVEPTRVFEQLFGKEAKRDERTGALVPAR